jgi:hypothetical protein
MLASKMPTVATVIMMIGWSKGIAAQVNLPNISACLLG